MRQIILLILVCFSLSVTGQQKKSSGTQKAKTTATTKKQTTTKQKAAATSKKGGGKKQTTQKQGKKGKKSSGVSRKDVPTTKDIRKLQDEQAALQKQIKESEALLSSTKRDVKSQLANLSIINGRIDAQQKYINGIKTEVDTLTHNIGVLNVQLANLEKELDDCKRKYTHGVMYMYRNRLTQNKLMFIFSADNFEQMYRRLRYAKEYTKYQRAQGKIIQDKEEAVKSKKAELEHTNQLKQQLLTEGQQQQAVLEGQKQERQKVVNQLNKKQKQLQNALNEQQKKDRQLNARIEQLVQEEIRKIEAQRRAEEARRKAEEEKRRREQEAREKAAKNNNGSGNSEGSKGTKGSKGSKGSNGSKDSKTSSSASDTKGSASTKTPKFNAPDNADTRLSNDFASNRGRLPVPITGPYVISAHYGLYTPEGLKGVTLDKKGTEYTGQAGAQARCVFDGVVSKVFQLGGMTHILVRHGSYISFYCNLRSASVRTGQQVSTRQSLGPVARDASGNYVLQFQLYKETSKLNPEQWVGR